MKNFWIEVIKALQKLDADEISLKPRKIVAKNREIFAKAIMTKKNSLVPTRRKFPTPPPKATEMKSTSYLR